MHRIIFVIAVFLFSLSSVMGQMIPINLPADGNWPTIVGDSIMIIGPRQNELTEEQRYFNPVYLMTYPGKEHLKAQMIRAGACDCDLTKPNRRIGVFSVAPDKQVSFSQGNLQYLPAINLWKFANTQYEYLGNANKYLKPTFRNWVDLFGWSANNTTAPFGVSTSTNVADYAGDFVDWGTNTICGDAPNTWRTLSIEEWKYLYHERKNADKLFALGTINGIAGMILLPDDWQLPEGATCQLPTEKGLLWDENYNGGGYINTNTQANHYQDNIYTLEQWQVMEEAGAVFLPAAGYRENTNFSTQSVNPPSDYVGSYATSTIADKNNYYFMRFIHREVRKYSHSLYRGRAVRLVHDTIVPKPPKRIGVFSVAADKQVSFSQGNVQYTQSTDEWRFAREQYEYIGAENIKDGALADKIDLFGWSANNTTAPFGVSTSTNAADYAGNFVDWGVNTISGDEPGTWRTLSIAEWEYLLNGRENAEQLRTKGSVEGKEGVILLPDNWICPEGYTIAIIPDEANLQSNVNTYSQADWSKLEAAGAIILPSAGMRRNATELEVGHPNVFGGYWTCTNKDEHNSYCYTFHTQDCEYVDYSKHIYGRSVRLVHDTIVPETIPDPCLVVKVNDTLSINMMCVEGGTFTMGKGEDAHPVSLSSYSIGQTEVTQALWEAVMGTNPNANTANKQLPVTNISWYDCQAFINKLNQQTGLRFRLPTEAEWEYAARGGEKSKGYEYAGSDMIGDVAWYKGNSNNAIHTVAKKLPNELGIYDMSGNVWEWCEDYYDTDETMHVVKSGSFYDLASTCRIDFRTARLADYKSYIGLRLVLDERSITPEPEYVDLGLSVKWATFNVGASKPEDYGDYFAWGETETKDKYSWANYKWCDGDYTKLNKYCTKEQYGMVDNQTILQLCDDAAHTKLGGNWRMPTIEECQELVNLCTWTWTTINGINGHVITGPNGNTIFLPATGAITTSGLAHAGKSGYYWINSISTTSPYNANDIYNRPPDTEMDGSLPTYGINAFSRYIGRPIRPVYDDRPKSNIIWYTDEAIKDGSNGSSGTGMAGWAYLHPKGRESTELNRRY